MQQVEIVIDADGNAKVEAKCVKGKSCVELTKEIEAALGETVKDVKKPEYLQQQQEQRARAGSSNRR